MTSKKKNTFIKAFTIFLIVVFLIWTFATWLVIVFNGNVPPAKQTNASQTNN